MSQRPSGSRRTLVPACAAVIAVVALLIVGGAAGDVVADSHELEVEQDGPVAVLTFDESAFEDEETTFDVRIDGELVAENATGDQQDQSVRFEVNYADAFSHDDDLSEANVTVTTADGQTFTQYTDLRYADPNTDGWNLTDAGEVWIDAETVVGLGDGSEFDASAGDREESVTVTPRGSDRVELDPADPELQSLLLTGEDLEIFGETVTVPENGGEDPTATTSSARLTFQHPFVFEDEEYTVTVVDGSDEQTTYWTTRESAGDGVLEVALATPVEDDTTVRVTHDDGVELRTHELEIDDGLLVAELSDDGRNVTVQDADLSGGEDAELDAYVRWSASGTETTEPISDVPYEDGVVRFGDAGYELRNGSYDILLAPEDGDAVSVTVDGGDEEPGVVGVDDGVLSGGLLSLLTGFATERPILTGAGIGLLIVALGGVAVVGFRKAHGSESGGSTGGATGQSTMQVRTRIVDDGSGEPVESVETVKFVPTRSNAGSRDVVTTTIRGEATVDLPYETYTAHLVEHDASQRIRAGGDAVTLRVPPVEGTITVTDSRDTPVPNASVTVTGPDGTIVDTTTDERGRVAIEVPSSLDRSDCSLTVEADRYQRRSGELVSDVTLSPRTGSVEIHASIDGEIAPGIDVRIAPDEEFTRRHAEPESAETTTEGEVRFDSLPVGEYKTALDLTGEGSVEARPVDVTVRDDGGVRERIDASFTFRIGTDQEERIGELHRDIAELTPTNRDGAIPYYFGSVFTSILATVEEEFPERGMAFVRHDADPNELTDAVLEAVEAAVDYTRTAMTQKQTVDLFSACSGLRDVRTQWSGEVDAEEIIEFMSDTKANHRRPLIDRLEATDELIREKRSEVSTISPVRDLHEEIRTHASGLSGTESATQRAHFFVGLQLLDAVERLFDQPELVDRLEETVF